MIHNRSGVNTWGCSARARSSSACSASPLVPPCHRRPGPHTTARVARVARRRRAGGGSVDNRSRPPRRCRTRPGWPRCRASGSPCRRSPRAAARRPPRPGQGRVTVLGPDRGQQLPLQLLQWCLADRRPPAGQHRARRHGVRPLPRHRDQVPQQRGEHLAGVGVGVGSDRGALSGLLLVGFPGPPAAPAVRLSPQRALHMSYQLVSR